MRTKILHLSFLFITTAVISQHKQSDLKKTIRHHDSIFWKGYNSCQISIFKKYITDDFEFYHDKGGLISGADVFIESIQNNLCSSQNKELLRREVVQGSTSIFPLKNYGAILSGEHLFYLKEDEKKESLIEKARFTHIWKNENGNWKMSRVLSYDHQSHQQNDAKNEIVLTTEELQPYVGNYKAPKTGDVTISLVNGKLKMTAGKMKAVLYPESKSMFFMKKAPLTFEFILNKKSMAQKMIVREQGNIVEEAIKQ